MKNLQKITTAVLFVLLLTGCYQYASKDSSGEDSDSMVVHNQRVCVKYETPTGWSDGYVTDVSVMKGRVLNEKENYTGYENGADYAILQGSDAVIKLRRFFGTFTQQDVYGEDFRGRSWLISDANICN